MLFRRPSLRKFDYSPRYYDPKMDKDSSFRDRWRKERRHSAAKRKNPFRWILVLILIAIAYYILAGGAL